jgi:hypothetical protein
MVYSYYKNIFAKCSCMFISLCVLMKFYNVHRFKRARKYKKKHFRNRNRSFQTKKK